MPPKTVKFKHIPIPVYSPTSNVSSFVLSLNEPPDKSHGSILIFKDTLLLQLAKISSPENSFYFLGQSFSKNSN